MDAENVNWELRVFIEALTAELDRARDVLRLKTVNRPLTYSVQDLSLDLNVFPSFDGRLVRFRTAAPGEDGASRIELKLGSITDRVAAETTKALPTEEDVPIDVVRKVVDDETVQTLKRMGVESREDVERMSRRRVKVRTDDGEEVDFGRLAALMDKALATRPRVDRVVSSRTASGREVRLIGESLNRILPDSLTLNGAAVTADVEDRAITFSVSDGELAGDLQFETEDGEWVRVHLVE